VLVSGDILFCCYVRNWLKTKVVWDAFWTKSKVVLNAFGQNPRLFGMIFGQNPRLFGEKALKSGNSGG